jgi:hypothetical protein
MQNAVAYIQHTFAQMVSGFSVKINSTIVVNFTQGEFKQ